METYEREIYNFFTEENNFIGLIKIEKHYPTVIKYLKEDFWSFFQQKLNSILQANNSEFVCKITGPISDERTKIMIYKYNWHTANNQPVIAIAIQRLAATTFPFYGPWINRDCNDLDMDAMYNKCRNDKISQNYEKDPDNWFPFFTDADIDFKNDEEYLKILPDKRALFAESLANKMYELAKEMEPILDEIGILKRV